MPMMTMGGMHARPDGRAPAGVMGDHTVMKGAFSFAYQAMRMEMDGSRSGTDRLSDAEVLAAFPVTPTRMTMDMHMLAAMYGWSNDLSLMVMAPYLDISMPHVTRTGVRFTTKSKGLGDVSLSAFTDCSVPATMNSWPMQGSACRPDRSTRPTPRPPDRTGLCPM